jgi:hypothetical protein
MGHDGIPPPRPAHQDRQIPSRGPVGLGWAVLLDQLHRDLLALATDYQLDDFSTYLGGLRILLADRFDEAGESDGGSYGRRDALVDAAEIASEHTCQMCGAPGQPRFRGDQHGIWIVTACEAGPLIQSAA